MSTYEVTRCRCSLWTVRWDNTSINPHQVIDKALECFRAPPVDLF